MDPIVVIGAGLAGYGVLREVRKQNPDMPLMLIAADSAEFYSKPALSTALAKGKTAEQLVTSNAEKMAAQLNATVHAHSWVNKIYPGEKRLDTTVGDIRYSKLILATGAEPIRLPFKGDAVDDILSINDLKDYARFRQRLEGKRRVAIIGAGLIGSEFANDLSASGDYEVHVMDPMATPLPTLLPAEIGHELKDALAKQGVNWHLGKSVQEVNHDGGCYSLLLNDGTTIGADVVISAVGLRPNVALATESGLAVKRGIAVNEFGQTSDPSIFAIGDCAEYPVGVCLYITPIMAVARGVGQTITGNPTSINFPVLSVIVKTTAYPLAMLRPPEGLEGSWEVDEKDEVGTRLVYRGTDGAIHGYVLTCGKVAQRPEMDKRVVPL